MKLTRLSSLFSILVLAAIGCGPMRTQTGSFQRTLHVSAAPTLDVESNAGDVSIRAGNEGEVVIRARIRVREYRGGQAEETVRNIRNNPPIEQHDNEIRINRVPTSSGNTGIFIDYEITAPAQTKVVSNTGAGSQSIQGLQSEVDARTGAGNINVQDLGGDVELETGAGSIVVRSISGSLHARSGAGSVTVDAAPKRDWQIQTGAGSIHCKVPENAAFNLDADAGFGSVNVDGSLKFEGTKSKSHAQGKVGNGGPQVQLVNGAGTIEVE